VAVGRGNVQVRSVCGLLGAGFVHNDHRIIIQGDLQPNGFSVCQ